jgi:hypothetical protein
MPGAGLRTAAVSAERRRQGAVAEEGRRGADAEEEEEEMAVATLHHPRGWQDEQGSHQSQKNQQMDHYGSEKLRLSMSN